MAGYGIDLPGDFDEDQGAIDRRKAQLIAAMKTPIGGAGSGWAGGIANFLQNAVGTNLLTGQDAVAKDLAQRRAATADEWLTKYGKLDTPAVPEQVGTGPIAPPPGTPGVEPSGGGSDPMNTPEPGPNAPPEAFSATPKVPDTPAGWIGPGGGGMIPQGAEFTPNKAGSPMIPGSMSDKLSALSHVAQGGPMYAKMVEKEMGRIVDAPEKEAARKAAAKDKADLANQAALDRKNARDLANIEWDRRSEISGAERERQTANAQADRTADRENMLRVAASLRPAPAGSGGGFSENFDKLTPTQQDTVKFYATQSLGGDSSWRTGLGRASGGANLIKAVDEYVPQLAAELNLSAADVGTNKAVRVANQAALTGITKDIATLKPYAEMLDSNAVILKGLMTKIGNTDSKLVNKPLNWLAQNATSNPDVADAMVQMKLVQTEAARIIQNPRLTGPLTDQQQGELQKLINGDMPLDAAIRVIDRLTNDSKRRLTKMEDQQGALRNNIKGAMEKKEAGTTPPAAAGGAPAPAAADAVKAAVEKSGLKYEPTKYEYRVTADGKVQRRPL